VIYEKDGLLDCDDLCWVYHDSLRCPRAHSRVSHDEGSCSLRGYPVYFSNLLGVAKLCGVCVLLVPGWARLKEWAYVGFGITILSACYSHLLSGDGFLALEPLVTFAALVTSYLTRPVDRRFFLSTNTSLDRGLDSVGIAHSASREVYSHGRNTR
jgi:hypothetical protein